MARIAISLRGRQILAIDHMLEWCVDLGADFLGPSIRSLRDEYTTDRWPARPLRIGVVTPGDWCRPLFDQVAALPVEWVSLSRSVLPRGACERYLLDAVLETSGESGILIQTAQNAGLPSQWNDWSQDRDVAFPTVFPSRLDPTQLHWSHMDDLDWPLAHHLLVAAAVMSRLPARTTFRDIILGRHFPQDSLLHVSRGEAARLLPHRNWLDAALLEVAQTLIKEPAREPTPVRTAAARLCGAAATMTDWRVDESMRITTSRTANTALGNDPISLLQLAAVQIGCFRDEEGLRTLGHANAALRLRSQEFAPDQTAFLHAEAATGERVPLTTGRLAAGMCVAFAMIAPTHVKFEADDFFEELKDSSLLLGREPDIALLKKVGTILATGPESATTQTHPTPIMIHGDEAVAEASTAKPKRASRKKAA